MQRLRANGARANAPVSTFDPTTEAGAQELADRIVRHWSALGYVVKAWPVRHQVKVGLPLVWGVGTDLVNGLPRRAAPGIMKKEKADEGPSKVLC